MVGTWWLPAGFESNVIIGVSLLPDLLLGEFLELVTTYNAPTFLAKAGPAIFAMFSLYFLLPALLSNVDVLEDMDPLLLSLSNRSNFLSSTF